MKIQDFAKLIRQTPRTIMRRCDNGEIPAKKVISKKFGGWQRWEIDEDYVNSLIGKK